ncbi:bifunctional 4-hydroxy-2-oxoglutarate aldolase/2-dehydro-3-deoxy-phosphogluconate aldolase [Aeromicrobium sp. CF3.5]|uniref:bifunctional 4-hydroxy-2-oxoglutarate aldolase/2-dehydro-3-deoxy-phosphogluconate aldolase n=1 Tax=Aeromicrobium sp. CF3.5 TaxID=3373078 RepID=UPI003EE7C394
MTSDVNCELRERLTEHRLVAIIRGDVPDACVRTAVALAEEGVRLLEVSLTTAGAIGVLSRLSAELGDEVRLGAGTVLTAQDAQSAADAGAQFILTPALSEGLAEARRIGLPVIPGALTPSEVLAAHEGGAAAVKVFPANLFGPAYLDALEGPFPDISLLPVGGVRLDDVAPYLERGAIAVGVGSPLCGDAPSGGDLRSLRERARTYVSAVHQRAQR